MANFTVDTASDVVNASDGVTSLREAIALADAAGGADTITFDAALNGQTITLGGTELVLSTDVTIDGDIDGDDAADITISGNDASTVFSAESGTSTLRALTITDGDAGSGGGVYVAAGATVALTNSTLSGNAATYDGGGVFNSDTATLTITNSTLSVNTAWEGGGIYNQKGGTTTLLNSTLSGNTAYVGGGMFSRGTAELTNSIVLGNSAATGPEIEEIFGTITSTTSLTSGTAPDVFAALDANGGGLLADNGGPVQTIALNTDVTNLALDAGDDSAAPVMDARGAGRADDAGVANNGANISDLGAFELQLTTQAGGSGPDVMFGTDGNDTLYGGAGADWIQGRGGDDNIRGGADGDTLEGGAGVDYVLYTDSASGVTVDLNADGDGVQSASGGSADGDVISGFEKVFGSAHADVLTGDAADNQLVGWLGADTLNGGDGSDILRGDAGADIMDGGGDDDWVMYFGSTAGVTVSLVEVGGFQSATGGDATGDVISNFERVWGSDHADDLTGNDGDNYLLGRDGDDVMDGGAGDDTMRGGAGADTMEGGADTDLIAYNTSAVGVTIDLNVDGFGFQSASGGTADGDVISGFENVAGTAHADHLTGGDTANILLGLGGADTLIGGGGNDILRGGAGADVMDGGTGNDWVQYAGSASGVTVNLTADGSGFQSASGGDADGDVISGFEYVFGSAHGDDLTGNVSANVLLGGDGDDTINGGGGADYLRGGSGADDFVFDTALGGGNIDTIANFSVGEDTIHLDAAIFTALSAGALSGMAFASNADGVADSVTAQIIYETDTGALSYDADGLGGAAAIQFATLTSGLSIDQDSFLVI